MILENLGTMVQDNMRRKRRGIKTTYQEKYSGFCGWSKITNTVNNIRSKEAKNIFVGIFMLGARAMELPTLRRRQITLDYDDVNMMIHGMLVEKQRAKKYLKDDSDRYILDEKNRRKYELISKKDYRTFPVRRDNPLSKIFIEHIEKFDENEILYPFTYGQISYRINLIGVKLPDGYYKKGWWYYAREFGEWWPHRIRAERACQLRRNHKYDQQDLMDFFGWKTVDMPVLYTKMEPIDLIRTQKVDWK